VKLGDYLGSFLLLPMHFNAFLGGSNSHVGQSEDKAKHNEPVRENLM
jgi:hypothetical protein